ncbi:rCG43385 [Rattus norvegicus]|uniref:RCG43385 n=1 Tax=Rattus norvegicus TaxID=10116 RepID=A6IWC2_RAT|nr:rCG43385 [Rattus norvegicus]
MARHTCGCYTPLLCSSSFAICICNTRMWTGGMSLVPLPSCLTENVSSLEVQKLTSWVKSLI